MLWLPPERRSLFANTVDRLDEVAAMANPDTHALPAEYQRLLALAQERF